MPAQSKIVGERSSCFMLKLPCELLTAILASVDDWDTLKAAILTCKLLHATFQSGPGTATAFLQKIEHNLIMPYIVHDHCLRYRPDEWDEVKEFREPKQLRMIASKHWTGRDVTRMCETFRLLSELSDWTLDKMADELGENAHTVKPYSSTVKYRVLKACYRLEMLRFCNQRFFAMGGTAAQDIKTLMARVPPWVNEQMYSVFEIFQGAIATGEIVVSVKAKYFTLLTWTVAAIDDLKLKIEHPARRSLVLRVVHKAQKVVSKILLFSP